MKAARNARFRLIPGSVRAQVIASARRGGQTRLVDAQAQARTVPDSAKAAASPIGARRPPAAPVGRVGPYAPTDKQVAFYQRLAESPVFSEDERRRALEWLATRATRQTIKDQIDWLKRQVETRPSRSAGDSAA